MNSSKDDGFVRTARIPYRVVYALLFTLIIVMIALLLPSRKRPPYLGQPSDVFVINNDNLMYTYNSTYPLTAPSCEHYQ